MHQTDRHAKAAPEESVARPLLELRGLAKTFPGTRALNGVDLDIRAGEVLALVGANGSGKSTLIKVLAGYHRADPGSTGTFDGEVLSLTGANAAAHDRIRFVHQDLGLVLELSAMDNLALKHGYTGTRLGRIPWRRQARETRAILGRLGLGDEFDVSQPLARATPVERTIVAIAAALHGWDERQGLLVLDEPTAVLPPGEAARLFEIVAQVRRGGAGVLYVSHRLDELFHIADRVAVLRGGELVDVLDMAQTTAHEIAELMVGDQVDPDYRAGVEAHGETPIALEVRNLRGKYLNGASFALRAGEVVGVAGLPGSGREELPFAVAGALGTHVTGDIRIPGVRDDWTPVNRLGGLTLPLVPDDRTKQGVVAQFSVRENLALSVLPRVARAGVLRRGAEDELVDGWIDRLSIKTVGRGASIATLSGGNQQKVLMARALAIGAPALVLCEPTAGVDIGSRIALYELIAEEARRGMAVVVSSSDVGDLLALCTRLLVLHQGVVVRELDQSSMTETAVLSAMEETAR